MPLVEQKLLTLLKHLSSSPVFNGVHVARSLVFCIVLYTFRLHVSVFVFILLAIVFSALL